MKAAMAEQTARGCSEATTRMCGLQSVLMVVLNL